MKHGASVRPSWYTMAIVTLTMIDPPLAWGVDEVADDSLAVYEMGEVVVTAPRVKTAGTSESVRLASEISKTGTNTVTAALGEFPGTIVTTGSKGYAQLSIRGFLSDETLVLFDGRPLNSPYYGDVDLNSIPFSGIGKFQVVKGPAPSAYGANTLGGMVNIVTDHWTARSARPRVSMAVGPDGQRQGSIGYGRTMGRFNVWASTGYSAADGFTLSSDFQVNKLEDGGIRGNSNYRHANLDAKVGYTTPGGTQLSLGVGAYDAERSAPPTSDTTVPAKQLAYDRFPDWTRRYASFNATGAWHKQAIWRANVYHDTEYDRLIRYSEPTLDPEKQKFDSEHDMRASGARADLTYTYSDRWRNSAGLIGRRDGIYRRENTGEPWISNASWTWSVFEQVRYILIPRLSVEAGAALSGLNSDEANASVTTVDPIGKFVIDAGRHTTVYAAVAKATRFPTLHHLYSATSGNPTLSPESAIKYETGISASLGSYARVSQDVFWNDTKDLIDRVSKNDTFYNASTATMRGSETGLRWRDSTFLGALAITYLDARASLPPTDGVTAPEVRRRWLPRWKIDYEAEVTLGAGFRFNHTGQYVADRVNSSGSPMPDYFVANLRVSRPFGDFISTFVGVRNVFDRNYEQETGYPMPGRTILLGIETRP